MTIKYVWNGFAQNDTGDVLGGATVTVRDQDTNALSTLYTDKDGGTEMSNPFVVGDSGQIAFYASSGRYKITAVKDSDTVTFEDELIGVPDDALQTVDTLAELQASTHTIGAVVKTKGYYSVGDGGGAEYLTVADGTFTDGVGLQSEGGSFVQGVDVQYQIVQNKKMSPLQFGAKADDSTFDDTAISRFVNYVKLTGTENSGVYKAGVQPSFGGASRTYRLAAAMDVRDIENVTWKGNGATIRIDPPLTEAFCAEIGSTSTGGSGTGSLRKQQYVDSINFQGTSGNALCKGAINATNVFDIEISKSIMTEFNDHPDAEVVVYDSGFNFKLKDCEIGFNFQTDGNGNQIGYDQGTGLVLKSSYLETSTIEILNTTIYGGKYCVYIPEQEKTTDAIVFRQCHFNRPYRYGVFADSSDGPTSGGALRITSMKFEDVHFEGYLSDISTVDPRPIYIDATTLNNEAGKGIYGLEINGLYLSGVQHGPYLKGCENGCTIENVWYATTSLTYSTITFTGSSNTTYNVIELAGGTIAKIEGVWPQIQEQSAIGTGDTVKIRHILAPSGNVIQRSGEGELDDSPLNRAVMLTPPKYDAVAPVINTNVTVDFNEPRAVFGTVNFFCDTTGASGASSRVFVSYDGSSGNEVQIADVVNDGSRYYGSVATRLDAGTLQVRAFGGDVTDNFQFWLTSVNRDGTNASVVSVTGS